MLADGPHAPRRAPRLVVASALLAVSLGHAPAAASPVPACDDPQGAAEPPGASPHNFLVLLLDDVGLEQLRAYDDVNLYRTADNDYPYAHTPTIDRLAASGVRFDRFRAHPMCSPSRAALQSGTYALRNGCRTVVRGPGQRIDESYEFSVPPQPDVTTLAELLGPRGYATGLFGKLHLALEEDDCGEGCGTGDDYAVSVLGYDAFRGVPRNANTPPVPRKTLVLVFSCGRPTRASCTSASSR